MECRPQKDFQAIIQQAYSEGQYCLKMITHTYNINELDKAFNDMLQGRNAKGVIVFD
jgi:Zn-dependent alcohol dehydrogenase